MLEEHHRLAYLNALDIPQWVSKAPLAFAKPSEFFDEVFVETPAEIPVQASPQRAQAVAEKIAAPPIKSSEVFNLQIQIVGKKGHYLMLVDSGELQAQGAAANTLLANIMKAWDSLLGSSDLAPMLPEKFKWPMFETHMSTSHIDLGKQAAIDGLNAFMLSCEKRYHNVYLLCFGDVFKSLLDTQKLSSVLLHTASLDELQNHAALKAELWKNLREVSAKKE